MVVEEGTGKEIGGRRNGNATMGVRSYEAGQDQKLKNKKDNERRKSHRHYRKEGRSGMGMCWEERNTT